MPDRDYLQDARRAADNGAEPTYAIAYALIDIASNLRTFLTTQGKDLREEPLRIDVGPAFEDTEHSCTYNSIAATWTAGNGSQIGICRQCSHGFTRGTDTDTWEAAHA